MIASAPRITTTHRYRTRQPDADLTRLDERIKTLEAQGDTRGRAQQVGRLRLRWRHLDRDKAQRHTALWLNEATNLGHAIDGEERYRLSGDREAAQ